MTRFQRSYVGTLQRLRDGFELTMLAGSHPFHRLGAISGDEDPSNRESEVVLIRPQVPPDLELTCEIDCWRSSGREVPGVPSVRRTS